MTVQRLLAANARARPTERMPFASLSLERGWLLPIHPWGCCPKPEQRIEPAKVNRAGIDLGEKVWSLLGMNGNTDVEWEFV
jgi:hypothetical protein